MKYVKYILIVILFISICFLGYTTYNYIIYNKKYKSIINKISDIDTNIKDMEYFININTELYSNDIENNSKKVDLLKKWERQLTEVEKSL